MRARLQASFVAGAVAILLNTALLKLADAIALPTAHGGLLRLIMPWMARPMKLSRVAFAWRHIGGPPADAPLFQVGFHLAVGMAMAVFYAFAVEPLLRGPAVVKGLIYAAAVWLLNAAVVLPVTGEGFAGSSHLSLAGMAWFAAAHTVFFVVLSVLYGALRARCDGEQDLMIAR